MSRSDNSERGDGSEPPKERAYPKKYVHEKTKKSHNLRDRQRASDPPVPPTGPGRNTSPPHASDTDV